MKSDVRQQVIQWLDHKDYEAGVTILSAIRPQMARIMSGRPQRYTRKLEYELKKLIGKSHLLETPTTKNIVPAKKKTPQEAMVKQEKPKPKKKQDVFEVQPKAEGKPAPAKSAQKKEALKPAPKSPAVDGYDLSKAHASMKSVPPEIEKIVKEHSRLFTLRSQLSTERFSIPQNNKYENTKRRRILTQSIQELSDRIELLFEAHSDYLKHQTIPDMDKLFVKEAIPEKKKPKAKPTPEKLKRERASLMSSNRRDQNKLDYQDEKKQPNKNPMPAGPKRIEIANKISDRQKRIKEIEKLLKDK